MSLNAEIISVGSELIYGDITDSNASLVARTLAQYGYQLIRRSVVADDLNECTRVISESLSRADLVITIGGLGPTLDDLTRDAIAKAVNEELIEDKEIRKFLEDRVKRMGREWLESVGSMALRPQIAKTIHNTVGAAPGLIIEKNGKAIIALPGPPAELKPMLYGGLSEYLAKTSKSITLTKTVKINGIPESIVEDMIKSYLEKPNPYVATYAKFDEVDIRIRSHAESQDAAEKLVEPIVSDFKEIFGKSVFALEDISLQESIVQLLKSERKTLATAESCTGGLLSAAITDVPGSSKVFLGGFVTYSNEMKARELGVARVDLNTYGAVSEPVALQMAEGVRIQTGADFGIGITGIAGPDGGTEDKPVGTVYISVSSMRDTFAQKNLITGDRETVRTRSVIRALTLLREEIIRE